MHLSTQETGGYQMRGSRRLRLFLSLDLELTVIHISVMVGLNKDQQDEFARAARRSAERLATF
jgi:hypothetical protein